MKLFLAAVLAALVVAGAAPAAPPAKKPIKPATAAARDWTSVATMTPLGNVILGNPQARVKVIEYLSFTCPHCAEFSVESAAVLKGQMIRSGSTSIEYRPIGRDLIDLGATLLVRCAGAKGFVGGAEEIFARQDDWLPIAGGFMERDAKRFALDTPLNQIRAGAQTAGLIDLMRARGLSDARIDACFADKAALNQMLANGESARKVIAGTPSFVINGRKTDAFAWAKVEPLLRAAGAR